MTPEIREYPVFEADQVLSQNHLNKLMSFLDTQDRLTRTNLLGMGIVCGLDIIRPENAKIQISCGTALTSLGFLISMDTTLFTHHKEATLSENFLSPKLNEHTYLEYLEPFFEYSNMYKPFENCRELFPSDSEDEGKEILTEDILEDKLVMLLLEVPLIDEKNCVAIDCADKGKRLEFKVRPLLIDREELEDSNILLNQCQSNVFRLRPIPRYNVPKSRLITGHDVLNAFGTQITKGKQDLHDRIKEVYEHFFQNFSSLPNYSVLGNVLNKINSLQSQYQNDIHIQYVADWMGDLAETYREISEFNRCNPSVCCPNYSFFPFHVLLGPGQYATADIHLDNDLYRFRTPFIKTGILAEEDQKKWDELEVLLKKLIHQLNNFDLHLETIRKDGVRITPSKLGDVPLSEKAMPYYYGEVKNLVKLWSPKFSANGISHKVLGYHSDKYNSSDDHVLNPLVYDTEKFNFFRIEGHIGMRYDRALADLIAQVDQYRLPIKIIALNASNYYKKTVDISKHKGDWEDLELDYDMARKKVFNITEYVINWIKRNKIKVQASYPLMSDTVINDLTNILEQSRELLTDDLQEFLFEYSDFYDVFKGLNNLFALHRSCVLGANPDTLKPIQEDLIDHFDEINRLFLEDPFTVIVKEAHKRWKENFTSLFLSKFLESHPGIEHKTGVPKGGTFILVYVDSSVFAKPKFKGLLVTGLLNRIRNYEKIFDFSEEERLKIIASNVQLQPMKFMVSEAFPKAKAVDKNCKDQFETLKGTIIDSTKQNFSENLSPAVRAFLMENIKYSFDRDTSEMLNNTRIPEDVIIGDFYLPYICCGGGGTSIQLPPNDNNQNILADFYHRDFNDEDFFTNKPE
jgi:hypothetical protein